MRVALVCLEHIEFGAAGLDMISVLVLYRKCTSTGNDHWLRDEWRAGILGICGMRTGMFESE